MGRYGGTCDCICQTDCVPTFSRPDGDVRVRSNWHTKPGGQSVYQQIDEVTHDDGTTYAYGDPSLAMGNYFIVDMSNLSYLPIYWYDHFRWWQRAPGAGRITVTGTVQHDATDIQSFTYESYVNEFWGQADFVVPIDVARNIADAENLKLKFEITSGSTGDYAQITQAEYERRCQDGCVTSNSGYCSVDVTITGTGTTHDWACCSNQFPDTLTATFSNNTNCSCVNAVATLRKIGSQYVGQTDFGCGIDGAAQRIVVILECVAEGLNDWRLTLYDCATAIECAATTSTCSPISLKFTEVFVDGCCCIDPCITGGSGCGADWRLPKTLFATLDKDWICLTAGTYQLDWNGVEHIYTDGDCELQFACGCFAGETGFCLLLTSTFPNSFCGGIGKIPDSCDPFSWSCTQPSFGVNITVTT